MLKFLKRNRARIVLVLIILAALWLGLSSNSFQSCIHEKNNADAEKTFYESVTRLLVAGGIIRGCIGYFIDQSWEAITALASVLLAAITYMLFRLGQEQSRVIRAQIRATVFVDTANITDGPTFPNVAVPAQGGCPNSHLVIKNRGDTPAKNVRHYSEIIVAQISPEGRILNGALVYPATMERFSATTIGKDAITTMNRNLGRALTPAEITDLANHALPIAIVVFGRITYDDAFGDGHRTDYCFGYAGNYPPPQNVILTFMTDGNYSD